MAMPSKSERSTTTVQSEEQRFRKFSLNQVIHILIQTY
jgi:hypothetical protein